MPVECVWGGSRTPNMEIALGLPKVRSTASSPKMRAQGSDSD